MEDGAFSSADGDFLIVPQEGISLRAVAASQGPFSSTPLCDANVLFNFNDYMDICSFH